VLDRLEELLTLCSRGRTGRLSDAQLAELARLYRAATTHLAQARTFGASAGTLNRLNALAARAHDVIYGRPPRRATGRVLVGALVAFPQVVRRTALYHGVAALLMLLGAVYGYFGARADPEWSMAIVASGDTRTPYADRAELRRTLRRGRDGDERIHGGSHALFASFLWQHNTKVALVCFFAGLLAGVPTILLLLTNGLLLGVYTATFARHGLAGEWFAWIGPHGVTEMLAVVLLSGGGLFLGRLVVAPGDRTRADALRAERGTAMHLLLFCFPMLLLAALLESFLRQSAVGDTTRHLVTAGTALFWAVYLGFARVPRRLRALEAAERSQAERAVSLPIDDELFAGLAPSAPGAYTTRRRRASR